MAVAHNRPGLAARRGKAQPVDHVVQAALQLLQKQLTRYTGFACGLFKVVAELVFQREVHTLGLLLLAELQTITHDLGLAVFTMLARRKVALFHGALVSKTLGPFQEQFHAFAAAKAADCTFISCHVSPLLRGTMGLQGGVPLLSPSS